MEGRVQGDPRPTQRAPVRLTVVVAIFLAVFAASAFLTARDVRLHVAGSVARDSQLTSVARRRAAAIRLKLDPRPFEAFSARLRPNERYAVEVPPGANGPFITRGAVVRNYAAFYFLPAIQVTRADRVFHYRFR